VLWVQGVEDCCLGNGMHMDNLDEMGCITEWKV